MPITQQFRILFMSWSTEKTKTCVQLPEEVEEDVYGYQGL